MVITFLFIYLENIQMTRPLSPEALNVWCRFCEVVEDHGPPRLGLAAALRAVADQLSYEEFATLPRVIDESELLAIAAELEAR